VVVMTTVGALAAPAVAAYYLVLGDGIAHPPASLVVTAAAGAGLAWLGWQNGAMLRATAVPVVGA
jgi:hypothetical protein